MHPNTLAFCDIADMRASCAALLFFRSDAANKTCKCQMLINEHASCDMAPLLLPKRKTLNGQLTAHLVRFCCWSLLSGGFCPVYEPLKTNKKNSSDALPSSNHNENVKIELGRI
jgi:hypothetical protein